MKKILICLSLLYLGTTLFQCSYEDECEQMTWIGTYKFDSLSDFGCSGSQEDNGFPDEVIIEQGSSSNTININGTEVTFANCNAETSFGVINIEYEDYTVYNRESSCTATYTK